LRSDTSRATFDAPAVLRDAHRFEVLDALAACEPLEYPLLFVPELLRNDDRDRLADHLLRRVAEQPPRTAVPRRDASVERFADDRVFR
jgi:hypothetical protein